MRGELKACRKCRTITTENLCPRCGGETTTEWHGYIFILDKEKSQIAQTIGAENGEYALRVR